MTVMEQTENENGWKSLKAVREIKGDKMITVSIYKQFTTMAVVGCCLSYLCFR